MKFFIIVSFLLQLTTSLWANGHYASMKKEAYALYENNKTEDALNVVKDFISDYPKSIRAQNVLAVLYYWSGDFAHSKEVLHKILNKEKFPQAVALLENIKRKEAKLPKKVQNIVKKKVASKSEQKSSSSNLVFLVNKVKKDPNDALSRKILALHYAKIGNSKQASYFANAVLKIDPDDHEMVALLKSENVSPYTSKRTLERALEKLEALYLSKSYNRFMNLYSSLENNNVVMSTPMHVNALHCAIELEQYEKAKSILHIYRMPKNKYMSEVEELLDEKLMLSRFAKDCSNKSCSIRR
jgi:tetratricopeptide (TPR) repeat protein